MGRDTATRRPGNKEARPEWATRDAPKSSVEPAFTSSFSKGRDTKLERNWRHTRVPTTTACGASSSSGATSPEWSGSVWLTTM